MNTFYLLSLWLISCCHKIISRVTLGALSDVMISFPFIWRGEPLKEDILSFAWTCYHLNQKGFLYVTLPKTLTSDVVYANGSSYKGSVSLLQDLLSAQFFKNILPLNIYSCILHVSILLGSILSYCYSFCHFLVCICYQTASISLIDDIEFF